MKVQLMSPQCHLVTIYGKSHVHHLQETIFSISNLEDSY